MSRWRITVLGNCSVESTSGQRIKLSQHVWSLLTFLLASPGGLASRGQIAAALWPECDEAAARHCLASAIWRAKTAFKPDDPPLLVDDEQIGLQLDRRFWVDSIAFDRRVRPVVDQARCLSGAAIVRRLKRAVDSYAGDFAASVDGEWALIERERLKVLQLDALFLLASSYGRAANWPVTIALARRLCAAEPLREDAQRLLMVAFAETGNRGLALKQFEQCRAVLAKELSVEPMPETRELYRKIANASPEQPEGAASPRLRSAVLAAKQGVGEALHLLDNALELS